MITVWANFTGSATDSFLGVGAGNTADTTQGIHKALSCRPNGVGEFVVHRYLVTALRYIMVYVKAGGNSLNDYGITVTQLP